MQESEEKNKPMMYSHAALVILNGTVCLSLIATVAAAQTPTAPKPPPPPWAGNVNAGLTVSGGNSDVQQYNLGFEVLANPNARHFAKFYGLFLRGTDAGELTVSRTNLEARDQHFIRSGTFVFGQVDYLRDEFKRIDYLIAPVAGIGYQLRKTDLQKLLVDAGAGAIWEKNPDEDTHASGVVSAGESFTQQLSATTTFTQEFRGLWKTSNFSDALLTISVGVATAMVKDIQLKVDLFDSYKNVPPDPQTKKNDYMLVLSVACKF